MYIILEPQSLFSGGFKCHFKIRGNLEPFESCAIIPLIQIKQNGGAESRLMRMTVLWATTIEKPGCRCKVVFTGLLLESAGREVGGEEKWGCSAHPHTNTGLFIQVCILYKLCNDDLSLSPGCSMST